MPVVVITGQGSLETAIGAIRVGAYDFITKPVDPKLLFLSVSRAIQHRRLSDEVKRLRQAVDGETEEQFATRCAEELEALERPTP